MIEKIEGILRDIFRTSDDPDISKASHEIFQMIQSSDDARRKREVAFWNTKTDNVELVDMYDALFVQRPKPKSKYMVYTFYGKFEQMTKGKDIETELFPKDFPKELFVLVDANTMVRKDKVKKYNKTMGRLYFTDHVDKDSLYVDVFQKIINEFAVKLGKENDVSTDIGQYAQLKSAKRLFS